MVDGQQAATMAARSWMYRANIGNAKTFALRRRNTGSRSRRGAGGRRSQLYRVNASTSSLMSTISATPSSSAYDKTTDELFEAELIPVQKEQLLSNSAVRLSKLIRSDASSAATDTTTTTCPLPVDHTHEGLKNLTTIEPKAVELIKEPPVNTADYTFKGVFRAGVRAFLAHQYRKARDEFHHCMEFHMVPQNKAAVLFNYGLSLYCLGDLQPAVTALSSAIRSDPTRKQSYAFRSILYRTTGQYIEAGCDADKVDQMKKHGKQRLVRQYTRKTTMLWRHIQGQRPEVRIDSVSVCNLR